MAIDEETSFTVAKGLKTLSTGSSSVSRRKPDGNYTSTTIPSWIISAAAKSPAAGTAWCMHLGC